MSFSNASKIEEQEAIGAQLKSTIAEQM